MWISLLIRASLLATVSGLALLLTSCTPQFAYQVLETRPEAAHAPIAAALDLTYDFWQPDGQVGCTLTNTTTGPVYLDLQRAHLVVNGATFDYYTDSEVSSTETVGRTGAVSGWDRFGRPAAAAVSAVSSASLRVRAQAVHEIPPGAHLAVRPMQALGGPISACKLNDFDARRNAVATYDSVTTPLRFRLYFTYSRRPDLSAPEVLDFGFRVEKITAMTAGAFQGPRQPQTDPCTGRKLMQYESAYPFANSARLYLSFLDKAF